jgi:hypothetical protein
MNDSEPPAKVADNEKRPPNLSNKAKPFASPEKDL